MVIYGQRYETGKYKGELKLRHRLKKLRPNIKDTDDFRKALDFLNSNIGKQ